MTRATPNFTVRFARLPEEEPQLKRFIDELQVVEHAFEPNRRIDDAVADDYFKVLRPLIAERDGRILVAAGEDGRLWGWLVSFVESDDVYVVAEERRYGKIEELFIVSDARRKGVGAALLKAAEDDFRARGISIVIIGVLAGNAAAHAAYESWGFSPHAMLLRKRL